MTKIQIELTDKQMIKLYNQGSRFHPYPRPEGAITDSWRKTVVTWWLTEIARRISRK